MVFQRGVHGVHISAKFARTKVGARKRARSLGRDHIQLGWELEVGLNVAAARLPFEAATKRESSTLE